MSVRYSEELADEVCDRIIKGEALMLICGGEGMPTLQQAYRWMVEHPGFEAKYFIAMRIKMDKWAHDIIDIADDTSNDIIQTENGPVANSTAVARSRERIKTRQWLMERFSRKVFAPPIATVDIGGNGNVNVILQVNLKQAHQGEVLDGDQYTLTDRSLA